MTLKVITLLALSLAALAPAATVSARPQTTGPGVLYLVKVTLTDRTILISHDRFTPDNVIRYPRGAVLRYSVTNRGSKPYVFQIWKTKTVVLLPGKHDSVLLHWDYRGTYHYATLLRGHPTGHGGTIVIF